MNKKGHAKPNRKAKASSGTTGNKWADHFTRKARKEKYPARSVYKLKEIQQKYRLLKPGQKVLDLGCAPGAWTIFAAECIGKTGRVTGVDLKAVNGPFPETATVYQADILELAPSFFRAAGAPFHGILSDLAPSTTGNSSVDTARSMALCEAALDIAEIRLAPGGFFVCKVFQGPDFQDFIKDVKSIFTKYKIFKPQSSRKASREIYIIGFDKAVNRRQ